MPIDVAGLHRGSIVYGVFPFAAQFPMRRLDESGTVGSVASIDDYVRAHRGATTTVLADVKMRPVLLLHDGTRGDKDDVIGLRINSVRPRFRSLPNWKQVEGHEHPFFFHLPIEGRYGLPAESVIALTAVTSIHKSALWRSVGSANAHEMQIINERLRTVLSLDLAPLIARQARELLKRAGIDI